MTPNAQLELLQLYDMAIQYDVTIIAQCETLNPVWQELFFEQLCSPKQMCKL